MLTEEEVKRTLEIVEDTKNWESDTNWILEKYHNLQLQLIAIAGAVFSIFFALKTAPVSNLTKLGFIFLATSLVFGLVSVIFAIMSRWWILGVKAFKAKMFIYDPERSDEFKQFLTSVGRSDPPDYIKQMHEQPTLEKMEVGTRIGTLIFVSLPLSISSWTGIAQLLSFLIATIFLLFSLVYI